MNANKKGFEFSFGWMFAIIVGAVIIFLAIYATTNLINTERRVSDTQAGKELGIILTPVETNLESGRLTGVTFSADTRVFNECEISGDSAVEREFGVQKISIASKSGLGSQWQKPGVPSSFYNKYIFSDAVVEARQITLFSKPFKMPFQVASFIYIIPAGQEYCFVNAPKDVEDDLTGLNFKNLNFTSDVKNCKKESKSVCFADAGCDVSVDLGIGAVRKNNKKIYYENDQDNSLLYGAIFSDPIIYECQLKRVMARTASLADIYSEKSRVLSVKGCSSNLEPELEIYSQRMKNFTKSLEINEIKMLSDELGRRNELLSCKLF